MPTPAPARRKRVLAACTALAALGLPAGAGLSLAPTAAAATPGSKGVTATLFEWKFDSVAKACTDTLGPKGYGFVEVSPPQEHIQGAQWWTSYQPVSYKIAGRLGDRTAFKNMVTTCHNAGVKVLADSVINHMSAGSGTGTGGTAYTKYNYPGYYQNQDFHGCRTDITNYGDRANVQNCELAGLSDLDTGSAYVQQTIANYLSDLLSLGVDGFRIDAAKHMAATDLAAVKAKMSNPNAYWVQEVIYGAGEAVQPSEYTGNGDVDEFRSGTWLKSAFNGGKISDLQSWGSGLLASTQARTFVDNWDTERNGSTLTYKDGSTYTLANVFMLAHPYGSPNVYSGYAFNANDDGPPNGGAVTACYQNGWNCVHAWRQVANMVGFRNAVAGAAMTNWWSNGNNAIGFGRGSKGYVAINRETSAITQTFQTSLPAGVYCDVQHGDPVSGGCSGPTYTVGSDGKFTASVGAGDAVALYVGATAASTAPGASFAVNGTTALGQNLYVVGDAAALGGWDTSKALLLGSASYPVWKLDVALPAGAAIQYKYLRKDAAGNVTWESGANRTASVPASGRITLNDTWRP
ncbi:carbohydrate-binding module family 20 domain-containing protein [Kitasatospora sp. CB02891]|uniref:carbohydrate-binding module family 20 domain-containing protein n=1 Tax=Kitasatospora sp. CB02891 TaxID=2020329 RepID=UPI000C274828|nr:carbohydrate-binding module family 20 domain-containing protein [Kitasatospora sp. CB02891]PJN26994.1 glycosidase [Kitasatospora sp. CB02891]